MDEKVLTIVERSACEEFSVAKIPHGLSMLLLRVLYKCSVRLSASVLMPLYSFHSEITLLKFTWLKTSFFSLILKVPICVLKLAFLFWKARGLRKILEPKFFAMTSLDIARIFEKEHNKVLRDIRELECSEEFRLSNFG